MGGLFMLTLLACQLLPQNAGVATSRPATQDFVYPHDPPVVTRETLVGLLTRFDADSTVIWAFRDQGPDQARCALLLAENRDSLRLKGVAVTGLYLGPPAAWARTVLPFLRRSGANFIVSVASPEGLPIISSWLTGNSRSLNSGAFLVNHRKQVVVRTTADVPAMESFIGGLLRVGGPPDRDGAAGTLHAEIRMIDLVSSTVLVRASADADDPEMLAGLLAEQINSSLKPLPQLVILPFRRTPATDEAGGPGFETARALTKVLGSLGWRNVTPPHVARSELERVQISPLAVEFDAQPVVDTLKWQTVVVGTISGGSHAGRVPE